MRPVAQTPTEATDYLALSTLYGLLLGTAAATARGREPVPRAEVPVLAAATFALSKLIVHEKVETWIRRPFVDERGDGKRPKGRRLRYAVGELATHCIPKAVVRLVHRTPHSVDQDEPRLSPA